jgi:hypothetical protein
MRKQTSVVGSPEVHRSVLRYPFPARRSAVSSHLFWLPGTHTSAQNPCCRNRKLCDFSYELPPRVEYRSGAGAGDIPRTLQGDGTKVERATAHYYQAGGGRLHWGYQLPILGRPVQATPRHSPFPQAVADENFWHASQRRMGTYSRRSSCIGMAPR